MARGDAVEIVISGGPGNPPLIYEVRARRAGRRVEVTYTRTHVEITEVSRTGTVVATSRFTLAAVLGVLEKPRD